MGRVRAPHLLWPGMVGALVVLTIPLSYALEAVTNPTTNPTRGRTRMYPICPSTGGYLTVNLAGQLECKAIPICIPGYALTFDGQRMKCIPAIQGGGGYRIR